MTHLINNSPLQVVEFSSGDYHFGIDVLKVQEVLRFQAMTPVPLAPPEIRGLINLRGQIVTAIGMRERLHLGVSEEEQAQMNLIVSLRDSTASLIVDSVGDVLTIDPALWRTRPSTLVTPLSDVVSGVYELPHGLLLILDPESLCSIDGATPHAH